MRHIARGGAANSNGEHDGLEDDGAEGDVLRSDVEGTLKGGFGGTAVQSFFGGDAGDIGIIVIFGEVGEDEMARTCVEGFRIGEEFTDGVIGKVAGAAHHALLDEPRIGADFEHIEVVIGFEDHTIGVAEVLDDERGKIAEVGDDGGLVAVGAEGKAERVHGIVRNGKRGDFDITDGEALARADMFDAVETFDGDFGDNAESFFVCGRGQEDGGAPATEDLAEAADMVGVLVGDEDGVQRIGCELEGREAAERFAFAEAGIHEDACAFGFEQGAIARTAGCQN